jgi:hypothetical protein
METPLRSWRKAFSRGGGRGEGDPPQVGEGAQPPRRGDLARVAKRTREVTGPAQQGWGPDGFAGGAGAQP